ncbi:unnamed protein product [Symbiodinium sp. CCMP2592]|nr:unnamed protein product [Symbiodinium sp. CCMP2592]
MALEVLQMLRAQPGIQPNVVCFGAGITACAKGRHWEGAFALLDELRERALDPDLIAFNAAITACEKAQRWEFALELLMMMSSHMVTPDIVSFNATASACEKRSQWCWALWVASQTRCLPKLQGSGLLTISNACISACAKARRLREALVLGLNVQTPDKVTYNGLVAACRSTGGEYWDMIFTLMRQMQRRRVAPGADVLGAAADAALEAGQPLSARPVMKRLEQCCLSELTDAVLLTRSWSDKRQNGTDALGPLGGASWCSVFEPVLGSHAGLSLLSGAMAEVDALVEAGGRYEGMQCFAISSVKLPAAKGQTVSQYPPTDFDTEPDWCATARELLLNDQADKALKLADRGLRAAVKAKDKRNEARARQMQAMVLNELAQQDPMDIVEVTTSAAKALKAVFCPVKWLEF